LVNFADVTKYIVEGGTLNITTPRQEDSGRYQCVASNEEGVLVSNYGELKYACKLFLLGTVYKRIPQSRGFVQYGHFSDKEGFFKFGRPQFL